MKKSFFALMVAMSFALASTNVIAQRQYSAEETANANLVRKVVKVNGIQNPDLIFPKQILKIPFPNNEDRLEYIVVKDDELLKIADAVRHSGNSYSPAPEPEKQKIAENADNQVVFNLPGEAPFDYSWLFWIVLLCCVALLVALIRSLMKNSKIETWYQGKTQDLSEANHSLERELERTKNKLPIEAPEVADEKWLRDNNPLEHSDYVLGSAIIPPMSDSTITRVFGKKPDLIATAIVSTKPKSINMEFSHQRKALTGLKDAAVHIGWNWNDETKDWTEVGMVASVCSNGFEMNPEQIVKTDDLFTKIGVVSKERRPVTFVADRVPNDAPYPSLLKTIMIEFHQDNIADLKKSGLTFEDLDKKTKKAKK